MLTIGICDDRLLCRRLLVELINQYAEEKKVSFRICEFGSGEELLEGIETQGLLFDLVFLDNSMKKLTGLETAREIRRSKSASACNIVFVTSAEEYEQFRQVGPLQVVSKPCTLGYIETIFEMVLTKP